MSLANIWTDILSATNSPTNMLRLIILIVAVVCTVTSRQISNSANSETPDTLKDRKHVCQEQEWQRLGNYIRENMKASVDPCEDFQKYACGNQQTVPSRPDRKFSTIREEILAILENAPEVENLKSLDVERKLFQACMQSVSGKQDFENKLRFISALQSMDGLSAFSPLPVPGFQRSWQESDMEYAKLGFKFAFFDIKVTPDIRDLEKNIIMISPPMSRRSADGLIEYVYGINITNELSSALDEAIKSNAENINSNDQLQKRIDNQIILPFASNLEKIILTAEGSRNVQGEVMTVQNWQKIYNQQHHMSEKAKINWLEVLRNILNENHINIDESEMLYIEGLQYFKELAQLLENTSADIINAFVHLHFVSQTYYLADMKNDDLNAGRAGCLWSSNIIGAYHQYVTKHNLQQNEQSANKMNNNIRQNILSKMFDNWKNASSLAYAKYVMGNIKVIIGYPESMHDSSFVENYYNDLEIETNFFQNMLNYMGFMQRRNMASLRNSKLYPLVPGTRLITSDVGLSDYENTLVFSVDYLRYPVYELFNSRFPSAINYGALGSIISLIWFSMAHELGDDSVDSGLECFVKQANSSITNEIIVDTEKNAYQNMIFSNALKAAFQASESQQNHNDIAKLPGLEIFTNQQLFFLAFANGICNTHAWWHEIPVNQILLNMEEFTSAFQCSSDSFMNSREKCPASSIAK